MKERLHSLDALRAMAALLVFFYHLEELDLAPWTPFLHWGWIGVDLFFLLSGFFIGLNVLGARNWSFVSFMVRRFKRIAPAYYVSILLLVCLGSGYFIMTTNGWQHIVAHLLFVHSYFSGTHGSINGVYWSLGVEFSFYILMGLSALWLRQSRYFWWLMLLAVVSAWAWRYLVITNQELEPIFKFIWSTQVFGMLDEFAVGVILAWLYCNNKLLWLIARPWLAPVLLVVSVSIISWFVHNLTMVDYWNQVFSGVFSRSILTLGFALLLLVFVMLEQFTWFVRLCVYSGLQFIGLISYSLYIYHLPLMRAMQDSFSSSNIGSVGILVVCCVLTLLLASASYYLIEQRFFSASKQSVASVTEFTASAEKKTQRWLALFAKNKIF